MVYHFREWPAKYYQHLFVLIVATVAATFHFPTALGADPPVRLALTGPASIRVGAELNVKVTLKNVSGDTGGVTNHGPEGPGQSGPYVEVRDDHGNLVPQTEGYRRLQQGQDESFFTDAVRAGETRQSDLLINQLYDISNPGKYAIQVHRSFGKNVVKSNTITVTITR
jgi:hypothetical protein